MFSDTQHDGSPNANPRTNEGRADVGALSQHQPVLLQETLELLAIESDDTVLDATLGGGGHSYAIAKELGDEGHLIGIDTDAKALERSQNRLQELDAHVTLVHDNFRNLDKVLTKLSVRKVDKALFDLGWSSDQLAESNRGFSFQKDEPLLMTLRDEPDEHALTAREIVNEWEEENIADIIFAYGGERLSRRIARAIVTARKEKAIETTGDLVGIIEEAIPKRGAKRLHPTTRTFQALRITVNDEIGALKEGLTKAYDALEEEGRIAVITFHSLEDKVVKEMFRVWNKEDKGMLLVKKPIAPTREEVQENPRARSAKLRGFIKQAHHE